MVDLEAYTSVKGILTFRGSGFRQNSAYGQATIRSKQLTPLWKNALPSSGTLWGGGAGWTGQPLLVQWPQSAKTFMPLSAAYKKDPNFVEVIQASLNGNVYFFDLKTGKATRTPIRIGNPIKGTPSLDPRGYPLLYVGDGINVNGAAGFRLFNLITMKQIYFQPSKDVYAPRNWPGMDSSALYESGSDRLALGAENGLFYQLKLNTQFDEATGHLSIKPEKKFYQAKKPGKVLEGKDSKEGTENSIASYGEYYYYANNGGLIRCIDKTLKPIWQVDNKDDTDASLGLDLEGDKPMLYSANEVDKQGAKGLSSIIKIDGTSGKVLWKKNYLCYSRFGASPSNGGALASPIIGQNDIGDRVIFTLSRVDGFSSGAMVALDKKTGKTLWRVNLSTYAWSSPVAIYDEKGKSYILQNDHDGYMHLFEGKTGKEVFKQRVDQYLEASPAVFNQYVVFSSRTGKIYCYQIH